MNPMYFHTQIQKLEAQEREERARRAQLRREAEAQDDNEPKLRRKRRQ